MKLTTDYASVQGMDSALSVTLDDMIHHTRAVRR